MKSIEFIAVNNFEYYIFILISIFNIGLSLSLFFINLKRLYSGSRDPWVFLYLLFFIFYSLPVILELFYGQINYFPLTDVIKAKNDIFSKIKYLLFLISFQFFFEYDYLKFKISHTIKKINISFQIPVMILYLFVISPIFLFFIEPGYIYLLISPFGSTAVLGFNIKSFPEFYSTIALLSFLLLISNKKNKVLTIIFLSTFVLIYIYVVGKRYLVAEFLIFTTIAFIIRNKTLNIKVINFIIVAASLLILFSIYYQFFIKITDSSFTLYNIYSYLKIDFSRDYVVTYSFYKRMELNNLDLFYQGITRTFSYFIPRSIYPMKPLPFAQVITSYMLGYDKPFLLGWGTTTTFIAELVFYYGYLPGLFLTFVITNFLINWIRKLENEYTLVFLFYILFKLFLVEINHSVIQLLIVFIPVFLTFKIRGVIYGK
jgi:hypothetical protein